MDYKTKPISRDDLRCIAKFIRQKFNCKNRLRFNVIDAFERVHFLFPQITVEVVEDNKLSTNNPARCIPDLSGNYHIEIKESVYRGAYNNIGAYRDHIMHEICHAILCILGFTPILDKIIKEEELKPYESMEWQAKALCGEILVPYDKIDGLSINQVTNYCKVSKKCASYAISNLYKKNVNR